MSNKFFISQVGLKVIWLTLAFPAYAQYILPPIEKEKKEESRPPELLPTTDTSSALENVRNLKAEIVPGTSNIIKLSWLPAAVKDDFVIARSSVPIATVDLLLAAKFVAVVPPGTDSFLDQGLEPGSYYYAVAARDAIKEKRVVLKVTENYTGTPILIMQKAPEVVRDVPPPQVSLLTARVEKNQIYLTWRGVSTPNVRYVIYRAPFPIATPEDVARATQIAILDSFQTFYVDQQLPGPGIYYYAVATRSPSGAQDNLLVPDQSYTREGVNFVIPEVPLVRKLKASLVAGKKNEVRLNWQEPKTTDTLSYRIYRSTVPLNNEQDIIRAELLGEVKEENTFVDSNVPAGRYYYAVVSVTANGSTSLRLVPGENVTSDFVLVTTETSLPESSNQNIFSELLAFANDTVILTWKTRGNIEPSSRLHLYRLTQKPLSLSDIANAELVAKLDSSQQIYEDIPPTGGTYYYAIFLQTPRGLVPTTLETGANVTGVILFKGSGKRPPYTRPILEEEAEIEQETKELTNLTQKDKNEELNSIIRSTYLQGNYREAINQLTPFSRSRESKVAAKALFYMGLSYYQQKNYAKAIDCFVHPKVLNAYGSRARFWYHRSLEHLQ